MIWIRRCLAFVVAVAVSAVLASLLSTHFVLRALLDLDVRIGFGDRLYAYGHDVASMAPLFAVIVAVGYLIAFPTAALATRWLARRTWVYTAAGATAVVAALMSMEALLAIMPIAGARHWGGLVAQGLAGAAGGSLFAALSRRAAGARRAPAQERT